MTRAAAFGRWVILPGALFGSMELAWLGHQHGFDDREVVVVVSGGVLLLLLFLQRLLPAIPSWRFWRRDAGVDLLHVVFSSTGGVVLGRAVFTGILFAAATAISREDATLWPTRWPLVLQVALAILIGDLPAYWWHRLSHAWGPLWRLHALHHSSERLYLLSSARTHPLHVAVTYAVQVAPLVLLGAPTEVLLLTSVFTPVHGFLQHANIDLVTWPFNWVFSTCDLHRWHHSTVHAEECTNFGNNLIIWDIVFGTRYLPSDRTAPDAVGLGDLPNFPRDFFGQIASPFTWRRLQREAAARAAAQS
jgi:ornithine lipid hydroxylase